MGDIGGGWGSPPPWGVRGSACGSRRKWPGERSKVRSHCTLASSTTPPSRLLFFLSPYLAGYSSGTVLRNGGSSLCLSCLDVEASFLLSVRSMPERHANLPLPAFSLVGRLNLSFYCACHPPCLSRYWSGTHLRMVPTTHHRDFPLHKNFELQVRPPNANASQDVLRYSIRIR